MGTKPKWKSFNFEKVISSAFNGHFAERNLPNLAISKYLMSSTRFVFSGRSGKQNGHPFSDCLYIFDFFSKNVKTLSQMFPVDEVYVINIFKLNFTRYYRIEIKLVLIKPE